MRRQNPGFCIHSGSRNPLFSSENPSFGSENYSGNALNQDWDEVIQARLAALRAIKKAEGGEERYLEHLAETQKLSVVTIEAVIRTGELLEKLSKVPVWEPSRTGDKSLRGSEPSLPPTIDKKRSYMYQALKKHEQFQKGEKLKKAVMANELRNYWQIGRQLADPAYLKAKGSAGQLPGDIPSGYKLEPPGNDVLTYAELGIKKTDAWRWQEISKLDESTLEDFIARVKAPTLRPSGRRAR